MANHQGNFPNQMANQQMRNMSGAMGQMNMQGMPNQMAMMGNQPMPYNQSPMQSPGAFCMQNNMPAVMQGSLQGNMGNMQGNLAGGMQGNMPGNIPVSGNMQGNMQGNLHPNMPPNISGQNPQNRSLMPNAGNVNVMSSNVMNPNMPMNMPSQSPVNLPQSMAQNSGVQQPIQNMTAMNNHPLNMNTHNAMMSPSAVMQQQHQQHQQQMQMQAQQQHVNSSGPSTPQQVNTPQGAHTPQHIQQSPIPSQQSMITDDHPSISEQQQQSNQQFPMSQSQTPLTPQLGQNQMSGIQSNQLHQSPAINSGGNSHPNTNPVNNQPNPQQLHQNQTAQQQQQHQNLNVIYLCRYGQETVQDIVSRFQEVFQTLKSAQPPIGPPNNNTQPTDKKVTEQFRTIRLLFRRLRLIFERCNDTRQLGIENNINIESLIPFKDEPDKKTEPDCMEEYKKSLVENRELIEAVTLRNKQLREIIDRIRIIIWEINTMLSMRRS